MANVKLYLRKYRNEDQEGILWVSFYVNRAKVHFSTRVPCSEKNYDARNERIRSGDKEAKDKNLILDNVLSRINNVFVKYRLRDKKLTKEGFIRAYNRPDDYETFFAFVKDYRKKYGVMSELGTINTHNAIMKKLKEYSPELHFDDITPEWLDVYYAHLRKGLQNNENTAYKNMSVLRKYIRAAYKAGYMDEYPFENWHIKRSRASYSFLTEEELGKMIDLYKSGELPDKYHRTLELFLFMSFSSLHISDALSLKMEQFTNESFTYFRLKNRNSKPEPIVVPVSEALKKLLINIVGYRKSGPVFGKLPEPQTMNRYLKEMAKRLEIKKELSHKTGRHTFATYFLRKTKDLTALKEILGHSELRETLIYAHVLDESKQEGITCFNGFKV